MIVGNKVKSIHHNTEYVIQEVTDTSILVCATGGQFGNFYWVLNDLVPSKLDPILEPGYKFKVNGITWELTVPAITWDGKSGWKCKRETQGDNTGAVSTAWLLSQWNLSTSLAGLVAQAPDSIKKKPRCLNPA